MQIEKNTKLTKAQLIDKFNKLDKGKTKVERVFITKEIKRNEKILTKPKRLKEIKTKVLLPTPELNNIVFNGTPKRIINSTNPNLKTVSKFVTHHSLEKKRKNSNERFHNTINRLHPNDNKKVVETPVEI